MTEDCGQSVDVTSYPNVAEPHNAVDSVTAFAPRNVYTINDWSVNQNGTGFLNKQSGHYNGTWSIATLPTMGTGSSSINAMAAIGGSNIWGIGDWYDSGNNFQTLAEHWNGSTWTIVPSPDPGGPEGSGDDTIMYGATAVNTSDVWGVGIYWDGMEWQSYTMQWNGTAWAKVTSPNVGGADAVYNFLQAAGKIPGTSNVWAVGYHGVNFNTYTPSKTLILEFHC